MTDQSIAPIVDAELLADLGVGIFVVDRDGHVRSSNRRAREVFRFDDAQITAARVADAAYEILDEYEQPVLFDDLPLMRALRSGRSIAGVTLGFRRSDGSGTTWHLCGAHVIPGSDADADVVCTFVDVTEQRDARAEHDRRFRHLAENSADMIFRSRITPELSFEYLNPAVEQVLGYPRADLYADFDFVLRLMHPDDRADVYAFFDRIIEGASDGDDSVISRFTRADGEVIWVQVRAAAVREGTEVIGIEGIVRDVTDLKAQEADLRHQAMHDALTGIPNRTSLLTALDAALDHARETATSLAVLYIDLDRFKTVNDGLGHDAGDRVLTALAARLADVMRPTDSVGRIGGDEFAAVLSGVGDVDEAGRIATDLLGALGEPLLLDEGELVTTASIGVAFTDDCKQTPAELLRRADVAMYEAKDRGRSRVERYEAPSPSGRGSAMTPG